MSRVARSEYVMSHKWMSRVTQFDFRVMSHKINASCHANGRVMSHMWTGVSWTEVSSKISLICMSHVTLPWHLSYAWVRSHCCNISHMHESCHKKWIQFMRHPSTCVNSWCIAYAWVMSHISIIHVTKMDQSRHAYRWIWSHIWASHGTHVDGCLMNWNFVMSLICMSHVTRINDSCHENGWVMSRVWMHHVTHTDESCRAKFICVYICILCIHI